MSYCVNCGVELTKGAKACPLCSTPVINPNELDKLQENMPFPQQKGQVEQVRRKDVGILITVLLCTIAVTCCLLNMFVFQGLNWSYSVIGACLCIWMIQVPLTVYEKATSYTYISLDFISVAFFLALIARMIHHFRWFWELGLPIVCILWFLVELGVFCYRKVSDSIFAIAIYLFTGLGLLCMGLDLLIRLFRGLEAGISWSAVVVTVCIVFDAVFITMMSHKRMRNEVRRRLHF